AAGAVRWFVFSSRSRHTRFSRGWSSDVCSSDLAIEAVADVAVLDASPLDLQAVWRLLFEAYGVRRLLSEGGPRFNHGCLKEGLVDEIFWTVAPRIAGSSHDLTMVSGPALLQPMPRLELVSAYCHENELFLRWRLVEPE